MIVLKKIAYAAASFLACALMLTGCHGSKEKAAFELPEQFDESKKIEIVFWAKNDTNKAQTDIYKKAADDFSKIYPNVTVNIRFYTDAINTFSIW